MAKREKIMKIFELLSKDCEGGDWYVLIRGTYEECYDYRSMDEAEQDKLGICVDYQMRETYP
jgi:hypothetical protein